LRVRYTSIILFFALLFLPFFSFSADQNGQKEQTSTRKSSERSEPFTVKVPVDVVVVSITAKDKSGNAVKDLTVSDFKVYEDGKPVPIHTFASETYKAIQSSDDDRKNTLPTDAAGSTKEGETDSFQPRMISMFVDDITNEKPEDLARLQQVLAKFLESGLQPGDLVSLQTASGKFHQDFTSNRELLHSLVSELLKKVSLNPMFRSDCPEMTDLQAYLIYADNSDPRPLQVAAEEAIICLGLTASQQGVTAGIEPVNANTIIQDQAKSVAMSAASTLHNENQFRYRQLLFSLKQHLRSLKHFEGRKSLILFSDGFLADDIRFDLQDVVDTALRSGVVFNTVDIRGLYTTVIEASKRVTVGNNSRSFAILSMKPLMRIEDAQHQEDSLRQLSGETGGIHVGNTNDLVGGIQKIIDNNSFSYVLSYASPLASSDGRYHKIKIEVGRPGIQINYRKGYYAPKEQRSLERRKKEDIIEALHAPGNLNEIPIQLSYNYFQVDDSRYQLALLTRVTVRGLKFVEEDSRFKNMIDLVVIAFDENDQYVDGLEKSMELNLTDPSYKALLANGFTSKVDIKVPPGRYKIRAVVREGVNTKMGSIHKTIEVP